MTKRNSKAELRPSFCRLKGCARAEKTKEQRNRCVMRVTERFHCFSLVNFQCIFHVIKHIMNRSTSAVVNFADRCFVQCSQASVLPSRLAEFHRCFLWRNQPVSLGTPHGISSKTCGVPERAANMFDETRTKVRPPKPKGVKSGARRKSSQAKIWAGNLHVISCLY